MNIQRICKHLMATQAQVNRSLPVQRLHEIEQAIKASELRHRGEIRFAVEGGLDLAPLLKGQTPKERALEVFSQLRVWDTAQNNGVLIYLLLADRAVEIVADRGIHAAINAQQWADICKKMEGMFARGKFVQGLIQGIEAVTLILSKHFPSNAARTNELADAPVIL